MTEVEAMGTQVAEVPLEIRIKEVNDLAYFWAQIGTVKHLLELDNHQAVISSWCEACTASAHRSTALLRPAEIVVVRSKTKGTWVRSKVTTIVSDSVVELFHVDTGTTEYADVSTICAGTPPMLDAIPQQALPCLLAGVKQLEESSDWSKEAEARFVELTSVPAKTLVHSIVNEKRVVLSVFVPYNGKFTSVGEILRIEGLVKYDPSGPLTLSVPVPSELSGSITPRQNKSPATLVTDAGTPETVGRRLNFDRQPSAGHTCSIASSSGIEAPLSSTPIEAHLEDSPKSPPMEDFPSGYIEDPLHLELASKLAREVPVDAKKNTDAADPATLQDSKPDAEVVKEEDESVECDEQSLSSSGSSLSDNDWLNEDLLPRRSGTSEVSDAILESPLKEAEAEVVTEPEVAEEEVVNKRQFHGLLISPKQFLLKDNAARVNMTGVITRDSRHSAWGAVKGRGHKRSHKSDWESKEKSWGVMKGRGRINQDKVYVPYQSKSIPGPGQMRALRGSRQPFQKLSPYQGEPKHISPEPRESDPDNVPEPRFPVAAIPTESTGDSPMPSASYSQQIKVMTEQEVADEVKWQEWKIEKELGKVFSSLTPETVQNCKEEMEELLLGSSAEKLHELPMSRQPLEIVVEHLLSESAGGTLNSDLAVAIIEFLVAVSFAEDFCLVFLMVVKRVASQLTESADSQEGNLKCHTFCHFLGSLFASSFSSQNSKYQDIIVSGLNGCLVTWSELISLESITDEQQGKCRVDCFSSLLTCIDLAANKKIWGEKIASLMEGPVKDCMLCDSYPRYIRDAWCMVSIKIVKTLLKESTPPTAQPVHSQEPPPKEVVAVPLQGTELNQQLQYGTELNQQLQHGMELNQVAASLMSVLSSSPTSLPSHAEQFQPYRVTGSEVSGAAGAYSHVMLMLETLHMTELLPKFKDAMIKDSVLGYSVQSVHSCLKDAGIPSGAIVEIIHFLEHSGTLPGYAKQHQQALQQSQPSSPGSPSSNAQLQYYPTPGTLPFPSAQLQANPYQMRGALSSPTSSYVAAGLGPAYAAAGLSSPPASQFVSTGTYNAAPLEGIGYTGRKPCSPLTTYQMVPPSPGNKEQVIQSLVPQQQPVVPQQQQFMFPQQLQPLPPQQQLPQHQLPLVPQPASENKDNIQPTLKRLNSNPTTQSPTAALKRLNSEPATPNVVTAPGDSGTFDSPPLGPHKPRLSSSQPYPGTPFPSATKTRPPARFGCVTCVICGGKDHVTPNCTQRNKFFTHM